MPGLMDELKIALVAGRLGSGRRTDGAPGLRGRHGIAFGPIPPPQWHFKQGAEMGKDAEVPVVLSRNRDGSVEPDLVIITSPRMAAWMSGLARTTPPC